MAEGTREGLPGYVDVLPAKFRGICELIVVRSKRSVNIDFVGLVCAVLLLIW